MKLGVIIGRVTLSRTLSSLEGGRWLIISPFTREHYQNGTETPPGMSNASSLVAYDNLGAGVGQTVGYVEGGDAPQPLPKPAPIDAITAALVDEIYYQPFKK
jgi:microcompartment protein CcmK/EutM